jgi:hypothetical protein
MAFSLTELRPEGEEEEEVFPSAAEGAEEEVLLPSQSAADCS